MLAADTADSRSNAVRTHYFKQVGTSVHSCARCENIIAEKNFNKKYNEMLVIALARTDVELSPEVIGQYLFNTGYMAKSKYAKLGEIAQRASELREKR